MREILFKGKRTIYYDEACYHNNGWLEGDLIHSCGKTYIAPAGSTFMYEVLPETTCQSVGRVDDCKHKIFEGDIAELGDRGSGIIGKVFYNEVMSGFSIEYADGGVEILSIYEPYEVRVIGNIFDDPELLEEE